MAINHSWIRWELSPAMQGRHQVSYSSFSSPPAYHFSFPINSKYAAPGHNSSRIQCLWHVTLALVCWRLHIALSTMVTSLIAYHSWQLPPAMLRRFQVLPSSFSFALILSSFSSSCSLSSSSPSLSAHTTDVSEWYLSTRGKPHTQSAQALGLTYTQVKVQSFALSDQSGLVLAEKIELR